MRFFKIYWMRSKSADVAEKKTRSTSVTTLYRYTISINIIHNHNTDLLGLFHFTKATAMSPCRFAGKFCKLNHKICPTICYLWKPLLCWLSYIRNSTRTSYHMELDSFNGREKLQVPPHTVTSWHAHSSKPLTHVRANVKMKVQEIFYETWKGDEKANISYGFSNFVTRDSCDLTVIIFFVKKLSLFTVTTFLVTHLSQPNTATCITNSRASGILRLCARRIGSHVRYMRQLAQK